MMKQIQIGATNVAATIRSRLPLLNPAERVLGEYLLANMEQVVQLTIDQLAFKSGTSYSTVSRFCQTLGLSGFKELKKRVTEDILQNAYRREPLTGEDRSSDGHDSAATARRICQQRLSTFGDVLQECASLINIEDMVRAVDAVVKARGLFIIGTGESSASALYACNRLLRVCGHCAADSDPALFQRRAGMLGREDMLVCVSFSGKTVSILDAAKEARSRGATVLSISDCAPSPLLRCSDIALYTASGSAGDDAADVAMPPIFGQLAVIDILCACCENRLAHGGNSQPGSSCQPDC